MNSQYNILNIDIHKKLSSGKKIKITLLFLVYFCKMELFFFLILEEASAHLLSVNAHDI